MNGEGIIYIVNIDGLYIVFDNCKSLEFDDSVTRSEINLIKSNDYFEKYRDKNKFNLHFDNKDFWKNMIFFSNYFGSTKEVSNNNFIINLSKDNEVREIIKKSKEQPGNLDFDIQKEIANNYHKKILNLTTDKEFDILMKKYKVYLPELIKFRLERINNQEDLEQLYEEYEDKFKDKIWINKERYSRFIDEYNCFYQTEFDFEAAINEFSVKLMLHIKNENEIEEKNFDNFINELSVTKDLNGIQIAKKYINNHRKWNSILDFLSNKDKEYVLKWQHRNEFVYTWNSEDIGTVKKILFDCDKDLFFTCKFVSGQGKGYYSSGESSKMRLLVSMYDALKQVNKNKTSPSNNLLLLLDEVDAYYHPEFQIKMIDELLELVHIVFEDYYVQILITSNTPLEISDIPNSNLVYIERGDVVGAISSINTFGANIFKLLNNNFFINSTMGNFSKRKINETIEFLNNKDDTDKKEDVKKLINIIGEPIIKEKLEKMYYDKFPEDLEESDERERLYKKKILELTSHIKNSKKIDDTTMKKFKQNLEELNVLIEQIDRGEFDD